ncbi:unnamed protein product [Peronospora destructor]|uniref:PDZ domain-containing protein n=1 Tax=Peronospora destructor TaxID=86335 RepID=A0AAV0TAG4_9STRA|nr:unnamed protein product [Peronospora destructor]
MGIDTLLMRDVEKAFPNKHQSMDLDISAICEQQPQDKDNCFVTRAPPSFNKWLAETLVKENAACKIQFFLRYRLNLQQSSNNSIACTASTASSTESLPVPEELDEDHLQYEVLLWYGSTLGLASFKSCTNTGYPCVEVAEGNVSLPGIWNLREGDYIISINDRSTNRSDVPFDAVIQILDSGVRPAVLRFRRPASHELHSVTTRPRKLFKSARVEMEQTRQRLERSLTYVIWREEDGPLGISLKPQNGQSYPVVTAMNKSGVVGCGGTYNRVSVGDQLLTINHHDVFRLGFKKMCQVMQFAPKPLVLTLRRTSPDPIEHRSMDL